MYPRPMHYIAPTSSPSYIARVRAIALPCPPFLHLSPRAAAMYSSSLGAIIYFLWSVAMWRSHTALSRRMQLTAVGSIGELELGGLTAYANWSFYFAGTACVAWFGTFVSTIYPQRDFLRHLSRLNWLTWVATWITGVLGVVAYLASDEWLKETCGSTDECSYFWRSIQFAVITSLFATLCLVFWFNIVISSFTHAQHPHLFYDDSDEEDERWTRHQEDLRAAVEYPGTDSEEEEEERIARRHANRRANSAKRRSLSRNPSARESVVHTAVEPYRRDYPDTSQGAARRPAYTEEVDDEEEWTRPASRPSSRPASRAPSADEYSSSGEGGNESDGEEGVRLLGMQGRGRRMSAGTRH